MRDKYVPTLLAGYKLWIPAHIVNFAMVPNRQARPPSPPSRPAWRLLARRSLLACSVMLFAWCCTVLGSARQRRLPASTQGA